MQALAEPHGDRGLTTAITADVDGHETWTVHVVQTLDMDQKDPLLPVIAQGNTEGTHDPDADEVFGSITVAGSSPLISHSPFVTVIQAPGGRVQVQRVLDTSTAVALSLTIEADPPRVPTVRAGSRPVSAWHVNVTSKTGIIDGTPPTATITNQSSHFVAVGQGFGIGSLDFGVSDPDYNASPPRGGGTSEDPTSYSALISNSDLVSALVVLFTVVLPWLILLGIGRRNGGSPFWPDVKRVALTGTAAAVGGWVASANGVEGSLSRTDFILVQAFGYALVISAPMWAAARGASVPAGPWRRRHRVAIVLFTGAVVGAVDDWPAWGPELRPVLWGAAAVVLGAAAGAAAGIPRRTGSILERTLYGLALAAGLGVALLFGWSFSYELLGSLNDISGELLLGMVWVPLLLQLSFTGGTTHRWRRGFGILVMAALLSAPLSLVPTPHYTILIGQKTDSGVGEMLIGILLVIAILMLRQAGAGVEALADPVARRAAAVIAAVATAGYGEVFTGDVPLGMLAVAVGVAVVIPRSRIPQAVALARPTRQEHRDEVGDELRRQLLRASERDFFRLAKEKLASGDLSVTAFNDRLLELHDAGTFRSAGVVTSGREAAFGSMAGTTPWRSGLHGAGIGAVLATLLLTFADLHHTLLRTVGFGLRYEPLGPGAVIVVFAFRWAAYGFVFGYFYPRIRGRVAVTKAAWLSGAVLVSNVLAIFYQQLESPQEALLAKLLFAAAQCSVFALVLGLAWEIRLARIAEVPWTRVRNLRTLRALAVPVTTIVVAVATAGATTILGRVLPNLSPAPTPTVSSSSAGSSSPPGAAAPTVPAQPSTVPTTVPTSVKPSH